MILGLTGGIASGKTTVSNFFRKYNDIKIYDADKIAKNFFEEEFVQEKIKKNINGNIFDLNNNIDRKKLKEVIFKDQKKREELNKIIHPLVFDFFYKIKKNSNNEKIIFDVPLLFESGIDVLCDKILLIYTDITTQIERIKKRDNISDELAKKIINSQLSNDVKIKKADFVLKNDSDIKNLEIKVEKLYKEIFYEDCSSCR